MGIAACKITGCALAEHDEHAPDIHAGTTVSAETWEVKPTLIEGELWEVDVYAPALRDMTTAEARAFALAIMRQADLVDRLNTGGGEVNRLTVSDVAERYGHDPVTVLVCITAGALHAERGPGSHWNVLPECADAWAQGNVCPHREEVRHDSPRH